MTPTRWQQVDRLLEAVLELPTDEREAFLARACDEDQTLRQEVLSLLAGSEQAEDFFEAKSVDEMPEVFRREESVFVPGYRIGPYRILRELGRGGMGLVLLAVRDDDQYQKRVAIKLVSPSPLQPEVMRRFRRERQILADLEHPNIARLLDGGTTEQGWPYVVMEYVEGVPLTHYCGECKLAIAELLRLFLDVCAAVQYAHQNLIIHRDLKPANILVTQMGVVKLLDFGIAKLLEPANPDRSQPMAHDTQTGALMMTPEYASPEQMRGETLTTASDVYSLGVLLYELLTGHLPYQLKSRALPEVIRAVCETEPLLPSARAGQSETAPLDVAEVRPERFSAQLKGDLDNIVLMALQKEAARRYHTVQQLSEDIGRHLAGDLVFARQATLGYRVQRFVKRNRAVVVTTVLVLLTLLGGILTTMRQAQLAQSQARGNRRLAYAGQMHLAMQDWDLANLGQMQELVEQSRPRPGEEDLRGFEWYHLWRLAYRHGERFSLPHPQEVWAVKYSPDGQRIASGCQDGKLRVWDAETGRLLGEYSGHTAYIWDVAWSPDGQQIATAGGDGTARLWETATGRELVVFKGHTHTRINAATFSPDGKRLATGSRDGTARVWETATGRELLTIRATANWVNMVAFTPDGRWLATGHGGKPTLKLWDAATGREIRALDKYGEAIWSIAFSPNGKALAVGGKSGIAHLWEVGTGQELAAFKGHRDEIKAVAFSPDGKMLATASADRMIKLWDALTGQEITTLKGHTGQVWSVAFSPDGKSLVTSDTENTVKVWDLSEALRFTARTRDLYPENIFAVFTPDSQKLAVGRGTYVDVVEAATGHVLATCAGYSRAATSAVFSPDGKNLFTGSFDSTASVHEVASGKELLTFKGHTKVIESLALSPDGQTLATGSNDSTIKLWRADTGQELATLKHPNLVRAVAFSLDGKRLAAGGHDNAARLWDVATRQEIAVLRGHTKPILSLAFSPDGTTLATGSADSTVKLWQVATGRELAVFKGPAGHVRCLSFSPDGKRLATGSSEGLVRLWDVATQQELIALKAGDGSVSSVAFSSDGQTLVSSSTDPVVRLWRAAAKQEVAAVGKR